MQKIWENSVMEEIGLVTPTPEVKVRFISSPGKGDVLHSDLCVTNIV